MDNYIIDEVDLLLTDRSHTLTQTNKRPMTYDRQPKCVDNAIKYLFDDYDPYHNPVFAVWNKFFKLDIIRSHEITFNNSLSLGEDRIFVCDYLIHANRLLHFRQKSYVQIWRAGQTSLVQTMRSPVEYMATFKSNYLAMCNLYHRGAELRKYAINYAISSPITWILFQYTENGKTHLLPHKELKRFTKDKIIPFISAIDAKEYNAIQYKERIIRWILLHLGANASIAFCRLWNIFRSCIRK